MNSTGLCLMNMSLSFIIVAFTPLLFTENPPCSTLDCVFPSGNLAPPSITVDTYRTPRISSTTDSAMVSTSDTILSNQMEGLLESGSLSFDRSLNCIESNSLERMYLLLSVVSNCHHLSNRIGIQICFIFLFRFLFPM